MLKHIIVSLLILVSIVTAKQERFDGSTVYQVTLRTQEQINMVLDMQNKRQIDVWSDNVNLGKIDIRVPKEMKKRFSEYFFQKQKCSYKIEILDVQKLIDVEIMEMSKRAVYTTYKNKSQETDFFKSYHRLAEIHAWIKDRAEKYPAIASTFSAGQSYEKREQLGIRISGPNRRLKPSIFFHGAIHSREWISPPTVMWIANELLTKYETDSRVRALVDNMAWYIIPVANPDGYEFCHTNNRMWRKTRAPNPRSTCRGVDPNRNFDFKWNSGGSSGFACSDSYHGVAPLSAIETKNIVDFGKSIPNLRSYVDFHAYTQLYMRSWGWTRNPPADERLLARIGDAAANAISRRHRFTYRSGRIAVIIYVASGSSVDSFYGNMGIPSFALELRPATARGGGFVLPANQIIPTCQENWEGMKSLADNILSLWKQEQTLRAK